MMELHKKPIIGTFSELLAKAENGDRILLFEGDWEDWVAPSHLDGVVIRKNLTFYLNGTKEVSEGDFYGYCPYPNPNYVFKLNKPQEISYNNHVLYQGPIEDWRLSKDGMTFSIGKQIWLIVNR